MAWEDKVDANGKPYFQLAAGTTGDLDTKNVYKGAVCSLVVYLLQNGSTATITPKGRPHGAETALATLVNLAYQSNQATPMDQAAGSNMASADGYYYIRADGNKAIVLSCSANAGGNGPIVYIDRDLG